MSRIAEQTASSTAPQQSSSHIRETLAASSAASMLMLILSWPAFKYFFFGEAFTHLRIYNLNGNSLWRAAFSRIDGMFFRPGGFITDIWWHFVLPPDPVVYHIRNYIFCAVNLFILHRILLKFVQSRHARVIALFLFAASKMHMMIIGYINAYEVIVLLMMILLSVLFWFRYIESRSRRDYVLALVFFTLCTYTKDNGFIIAGLIGAIVVALAIKPDELRSQARYWAARYAPFLIVAASYWVVRYILTGPIASDNATYSPRFSFSGAVWQTKAFLATAGNLSLTDAGVMGERGFSALLAENSKALEYALCAGLWLLILFTLWRGRSRWRLLIVPLAWMGLYLFPIFLIRNHQIHYHQEPLVGLALLIGICLDRANRSLLTAWFVVVALIAVNGFISNRRSYYTWQYCANRAEVVLPIVAAHKDNPPKTITFVASPARRDFWYFVVGGPMVPHLLGAPDTRVEVIALGDQISPDSTVYHLPE